VCGTGSVGCRAWWHSACAAVFYHVQVLGKVSSVWLLESNAVIWAVFVLMVNFSIHMQVSLLLWLSSRLATSSASAGSNSLFTKAVSKKSKKSMLENDTCIKERLSTSAHTSQIPTEKQKRETTESNKDPAGCQPCDPPASSPFEASRSTSNTPIRSPIITVVVVDLYFVLFL